MTTAVQVQYRRGTQAQVAAFTGAAGEMAIDTTNNRVVVQDGATAGGWPAARLVDLAGGGVNKFRNGSMDVWQRGTSAMTVTTSGSYTADGWIVVPTGASCTVAQQSGRLLTAHALQVNGATGVTDILVKQRIEGAIANALASQTVTVQAWIYNAGGTGVVGANITPTLTVKHANALDNWSAATTDVSAVSLQTCALNAWTQVAYTFAASASAGNGLEITFDFGNNWSKTAYFFDIAECDIRVTNGVPTGLNASPPPAELRPVSTELAFCQRYYEKSYAQATAPGTATQVGDSALFLAAGLNSTTLSYVGLGVRFQATKRAAPTITMYSTATGTSGKAADALNGGDITATVTDAGDGEFAWYATTTTANTGYNIHAQWTATAEL